MKLKLLCRKMLAAMIPVLIPLLILGFLSLHLTYRFSMESMANDHQTMLLQMDNLFSMLLDDLDSLHSLFATKAAVRVSIKSALNSSELTLENSRNLSIIKSNFSALTNTKSYLKSINLFFQNTQNRYISDDNSYFSTCTSNEPWLANFTDDSINDLSLKFMLQESEASGLQSSYLWIWRPITSFNANSAEGIIAFSIKLDTLQRTISTLMPESVTSVAVYTQDGQLLFSVGDFFNTAEPRSLKQLAFRGSAYVKTENGYISYKDSQYGLIFTVKTNINYIGLWSRSMLNSNIILICASLVLALFMGSYIAKREYRGIQNMEQTLTAYEHGERPSPDWDKRETSYSNIMRSAINAFLQKNYLQVQLESKNYQMQLLELTALQAQINPHFLFNTLNSIQWKCIALTGGPNQASRMIESLASIFDYTLENTQESVTLERDLHYVQNYVEIEQQRFSDAFSVSVSATQEALNCRILKMLIQPILENSLRHGLDKHKGTVTIDCRVEDHNLVIVVADNGRGISEDTLSALKSGLAHDQNEYSRHIGLLNTQRRIRLAYGETYGLTLDSKTGCGTTVTLLLPALLE